MTSAAVLGWGAPMIAVAPSMLHTLQTDELDRVLIHEWAHVQRRDDLTNIVQVVVLERLGGRAVTARRAGVRIRTAEM